MTISGRITQTNYKKIRSLLIEVYSFFKDTIWGADLGDLQLISKINKAFQCLLCVIEIYFKYIWVPPSNDKKGIAITNAFQAILDETNNKPNKILVDKVIDFYNRSMKLSLQNNDVDMYSTQKEAKSALAERFIRTLKQKNQ